jgi:hypothetical protein
MIPSSTICVPRVGNGCSGSSRVCARYSWGDLLTLALCHVCRGDVDVDGPVIGEDGIALHAWDVEPTRGPSSMVVHMCNACCTHQTSSARD